jgi:hypothetical protein
MPKQVHYIRDFSGGINSQRNPRDISDNQTPFCQDAMGDRIGMLRTMGNGSGGLRQKDNSGSTKSVATLNSGTDLLAARGYGFKHFELDYDEVGSEEEGGEHYFAVLDEAGGLNVWDYTNNSWDSTPQTAGTAVDLGTANDIKANITAFDNGLRLCDSNLDNSSTPKYFKYIKRSQLGRNRDGFYGGTNDLQPPTTGDAQTTSYTDGAVNFNIISEEAGVGSWKKTDYAFAYTFVYDGNQESVPMICSTKLAAANVNADRPLRLGVNVANAGGATDFDARITGVRIYWKYHGNISFTDATCDSAEHLNNTGNFSSNWGRTGDMAVDATDATYTHSSGAGTLIQTTANRAAEGVADTPYSLTYTVSGFSENITLFEILGTGSQFAAATTALNQSDGTHTTIFTSHASDADQPFTINVTSGTSGAFNIDNVLLTNNIITHADDNGAISVGMSVTGTGIPDGAYVDSVTSDTQFVLSVPTSASFTDGTLTFTSENVEETEWNLLADCDFTGGFEDATCDTAVDDATVGMDSTAALAVGMSITGTGIQSDTKVKSITNATTFEMTNNASVANTDTTLVFRGSDKCCGIRGKLSDKYTMFSRNAANDYTATINIQDPSIDTYSTINGYGSNDGKLYIGDSGDGYKAAVYANRRMFVAGVRMTFEDGVQRQKLDRIMYSPVGKPDVFPLSNYIDIVQSDAEPYIKLEAVGDKLFAFKSDNLYVANIAGYASDWYLESTNKGMGVLSGGAVFRTDYGLVWVNPNGLYSYTAGGGISELTEDKVLSGYKTDSYGYKSWGKLITAGTIIGYDKKEKEIVIVLDSGSVTTDQSFGGNGADVIVYDLETKSFFFGKNRLLSGGIASNFDYDWNGDLVYATETSDSVNIKSWQSDDQTSTAFLYQTKDFDFGYPSRYKKIYAIYLTYKHSDSNNAGTFLTYAKDGSDSFVSVDGDGSTALATNSINQATRFEVHKITFTTPLKCQSIALKLNGPTSNATKIEINDIGIEYRLLPSAKVAATD